jgi:hypothetical protein
MRITGVRAVVVETNYETGLWESSLVPGLPQGEICNGS